MSFSPSTRRFTDQRNLDGLQTLIPSQPKQEDSSSNPPNTDTNNPSKPSGTGELDAIFGAFKLHKVRRLPYQPYQPWPKFSLSRAGYSKLQEALEDDTSLNGYIRDKIRYDYIPSQHQLVVRMPSGFHELVLDRISDEIKAQLKSISVGQSPSATFARDIKSRRSTDVLPRDLYYGTHTPDDSFGHYNSILPALILEISWSQKRKDLPRLADDYLLGSNGNIQALIGVDLEYRGTEAAFSIWEVTTTGTIMEVRQIVVNEAFLGPTVTSAGLRIPLAYFANSVIRAQYQQPVVGNIFISTAQLCAFVDEAKAQDSLTQSGINGQRGTNEVLLPPGITKQNREATPPDELLKIDEDKFETSEHRALESMDAGSLFDGSAPDSDDSTLDNGDVSTRVLRSGLGRAGNNA